MHSIALFLGSKDACEHLEKSLSSGKLVVLSQGFFGVLLFGEDGGSIWADEIPDALEGFQCLKQEWSELACSASRISSIGYIETEYSGGVGGQTALVYSNGLEAFRACGGENGPMEELPINSALRLLGATKGDSQDEFIAMGFASVRKNEDFL